MTKMKNKKIPTLEKRMDFLKKWLEKLEEIVAFCPNVLFDDRVIVEFNTADEKFNSNYEEALSFGQTQELLDLRKKYENLLSSIEEINAEEIFQRRKDLSKCPDIFSIYSRYTLTEGGYVPAF